MRWPGKTSSTLVQLAVVAVVCTAVLIYVQEPAGGLYGYDGPFHIKYSEITRQRLAAGEGLITEFPWWQETFFKDRFADKDFLYHLLLIPFASGDLDKSGKLASLVFAVGLYLSLFIALKWCRVDGAAWWAIACLVSSTTLLYRAGLLRSHVLAIALALLGTAAIVRRNRVPVAMLSALYALTHIAWHLLPGVALIADLVESVRTRRLRLSIFAWSCAGSLAAVVLSPYFPANLKLWWVQIVGVLGNAWLPGAPDLGLGLEFSPAQPWLLVYYNLGPLLFSIAGLLLLLRSGRQESEERRQPVTGTIVLGIVTLGSLGLTLMSRRFAELWAPTSVLFAGLAWSATGASWTHWSLRRIPPAWSVVLFAALGILNLRETHRIVSDDPGRIFASCATWVHDHVPPGEIVFTTDWDEFPELFFAAPEQRYLVGLDPTFMYATSPERFRLWRDLVEARDSRTYQTITTTFDSHWVFADAGYERFNDRALQDPSFHPGIVTPDCSVYSLAAPAEEPSVGVESWTAADGRATGVTPAELVDVERIAGTAVTHDPAGNLCARLTGRVRSAAAGTFHMIVSTDDSMRFRVNGTVVHDTATAPPPTIDDVVAGTRSGRSIYERRFSVPLTPGYNDVALDTCRKGLTWGFSLRTEPSP